MDLARLKSLIDLVAQSSVSELEITEGGERVRIAKPSPLSPPSIATREAPRAVVAWNETPPTTAPHTAIERSREHIVTSPMFGVFHRAPSPDSPPFVTPGQRIEIGQKLCVIEAMKSFNPICADSEGAVLSILVENGQEVELGQPLFQIEP